MRIAYVTETWPPELNGVALSAARAVRFLRERGHEVELVRPRIGEETEAETDTLVRGLPLPLYPGLQFGLPVPRRLARRWRNWRPDLVHVATEGPLGGSAIAVARWLGIPATSDFRTNFPQYSAHYGVGLLEPVIDGYLRLFHNGGALTFAPTEGLSRALRARGYRNVAAVGRGVDVRAFSPHRRSERLRTAWGVGPDDLVVVHVGRLAPEKNPRLALGAWRAIAARHSRARLVWVGDGPMRAALEREAPGSLFVGAQRGDRLAAHYASADIFVFPSLTETFGNVTLEAMASGLPIVAFDCAAAGECLVDGGSGLLAPPGDEAAFVERALRLAGQPALRDRLGRAARQAAEALEWPEVLAPFESHLERCVLGRALAEAA